MKTTPVTTPDQTPSASRAPSARKADPAREPSPFAHLMRGRPDARLSAERIPGERTDREPHGLAIGRNEASAGRLGADRSDADTEAGRGSSSDRDGSLGRGSGGDPSAERDLLAPFTPPPPALIAPPSASMPAVAPPAGTTAERAELAAMLDRLVTSMRLGRVGRDGHEVHLRLTSEIEVRLRHHQGTLEADLRAPASCRAEADRIADTLTRELESRGLVFGSVRVS